jgi:outer membrane protein TolC
MEALPDPTASVSYTNDTVTDFTLGESIMSNITFSWTQELPYPGKRRLAGDVARAEIEVVKNDLDATHLELLARVKQSYVELVRLERTRAILQDSRGLLESFYGSARRRYETGEGILENVLRAQTELIRIDADLAGIAQEQRSTGIALNTLLGRSADSPLGPALRPALPAPAADVAALEQAALERSPIVGAARAAALREQIRTDLAARGLKPDFMWTAAYVHRGGIEPMAMGMLGARLPLWRRNKQHQAVAQAQHEAEAALRDVDAAELTLLSEVRDLVARAERAGLQRRLYGEGVLPQARSALESAAASYSAGKTEFVTLIGDFLAVLEAEREHETQRAAEATALAALEPLTGMTLLRPDGDAMDAPGQGGSDE